MKEPCERILVVDDSGETVELVQRHLEAEGYRVFPAAGVEEAIRILERQPVELVITDLKMPRVSGLDLVRHVRENIRETEVMMITGYASIEGAVTAVKLGAEEYLAKPFLREELLAAVHRALQTLRVRRAGATPQEPAALLGLVGESDPIRRVHAAVLREAGRSSPVLLVGEIGTGKEATARALHYGGPRAGQPFLVFRAGSIPGERLESELFGTGGRVLLDQKGAGSAARDPGVSASGGFLQLAVGGTLFLDGLERLPPPLQERLVLEHLTEGAAATGRPRRGSRDRSPRLVAGTAHDPQGLCERGRLVGTLREAFDAGTVHLPPLRERGDDVLLLARHFLLRTARDTGLPSPRFSDRALAALCEYYWPGNVGELEAVVGILAGAVAGGQIDVPDLPSLMRFSALRGGGTYHSLAEVELQHVRDVLAAVSGNKTKAAQILGIDRKTLREKLKNAGEGVV
jgi:two-component system, NtrC family, response regulator HydG